MKRKPLLSLLSCAALGGTATLAALEVHEWGTFTTLHGSHGRPLAWYQPAGDVAHLPDFVVNEALLDKSIPAIARMETPVIYFYPDEPGPVAVEALFNGGRITESFPAAGRVPEQLGTARWTGELLPPDDAEALAAIPPVTRPSLDEPYEAARAVPRAWIFRSEAGSTEKFIFYRGAAMVPPGLQVAYRDSAVEMVNAGPHTWSANLLLEVGDGGVRWAALPPVERGSAEHPARTAGGLSGPARDPDTAGEALAAWFHGELTDRGLSRDEAAAMIATWRASWFREPGVRVFSLVPEDRIDEMLPLRIEPAPSSVVRVFVARHELLAPEKEEALLALVTHEDAPARTEAFRALELGRFADGAFQGVLDMEAARLRSSFHSLRQAARETSAAAAGAGARRLPLAAGR